MKRFPQIFISLVLLVLAVSCGTGSEPDASPTEAAPPPTEAPTATSEPVAPPTEPTEAPATEAPTEEVPAVLKISTTAFEADGEIPERYTCMGDNASPALAWSGVPAEAESLALLMYDLDAGADSGASTALGFAHWIVYNIPTDVAGFEEDVPAGAVLEGLGEQGSNDFAPFETAGNVFPGGGAVKLLGYDGPCPGAEHRYIFDLYVLDTLLDLPEGATLGEVLAAMEGHVIDQVGVVGSYDPTS